MSVIVIEHDGATGEAFVRFDYNPDLVELIKSTIPGRFRRWDPARKVWTVTGGLAGEFARTARSRGHVVNDTHFTSGHRQRQAPPPPPPPPRAPRAATTDWAGSLLDAVGPERQEAVFRALVRVLHPDTSTGSTELMQQLNRARDQRKAAA